MILYGEQRLRLVLAEHQSRLILVVAGQVVPSAADHQADPGVALISCLAFRSLDPGVALIIRLTDNFRFCCSVYKDAQNSGSLSVHSAPKMQAGVPPASIVKGSPIPIVIRQDRPAGLSDAKISPDVRQLVVCPWV